jgi:alkylation response protein AidB-like acyl-CoA dehydrogenase
MSYSAPVDLMTHTLRRVAGLDRLAASGVLPNFDLDLVQPVLEEANRLARDVLSPLNKIGHQHGVTLTADGVVSAPGFREAYQRFAEGGWMGLACPEEYGGQALPKALASAVMEMIHGSNMAFGLCPLLSFGVIEGLLAHGSDEQKAMYLPRLISGEWTGTMNLTEPQAGSDVGALKTRATPNPDGSYAISGQKIFITWGDHDMTDNIVHLVLARLPDAPAGSRGVSLFVAPKFLVNADGSLGARNGVRCIGLEKKMGIHASPTCVMEYDGATAWLVGEPNKGLAAMFTTMNSARLAVGLEGVGLGEAAAQTALAYALDRRQGAAPGVEGSAPIVRHPDVRRSLVRMQSLTQAARGICYACASAADLAEHGATPEERTAAKLREDLLTPIAKAWSTDRAVESASVGVQVHGGMGFMYETEAAQHYLDVRIAPIYEGTNGIQAIDLVGRKLAMAGGAAMDAMLADIRATATEARTSTETALAPVGERLSEAADALERASRWMQETMASNRELALAGATDYLRLAGDVIGGACLAQGALAETDHNSPVRARVIALARFFADDTLSQSGGRADAVIGASASALELDDGLLGAA